MTAPAVLVTGGARRIGAAIARCFGAAGWRVVIHYRNSSGEAKAIAASLPSAETIRCDLVDDAAALAMVRDLAGKLPNWAAIINSAAIFRPDAATELDPATNALSMQVNARTPALMAQAYFRHAQSDGQRVAIALTDQKIANPNPDFFSYTMSKHALAATVPMLAMAAAGMQRAGDRAYAIAPGAILPSHDQSPQEYQRSGRMNMLDRLTGADEIARTALFLAGGTLANGQTVFVDSGQHLLSQSRDVLYLAREGT